MKPFLFLIITLCNFCSLNAQKFYASYHPEYMSNADSADYHFENNRFDLAKPYFEKALAIDDYSFRSKFRLAICHFENGAKKGNDWLAKCAERNWEHIGQQSDKKYREKLKEYPDLVDWQGLDKICEIQYNKLDSQLIKVLIEIDKFDQGCRRGDLTEADYEASDYYDSGMESWDIDSVNLARMEVIFAKYGYPGKDLVGPFLSYTGYLVLQHADHNPSVQESYFEFLKTAAENHQAPKSSVAYLNDRIKVNKGECQDFGTQMGYSEEKSSYFIRPINDIENLDKRRQEYHIMPISEYLENWGLTLSKDDECKN